MKTKKRATKSSGRAKRGSRAETPKKIHELGKARPSARLDDERLPDQLAREHPDGPAPPLDRKTQYKNTDEAF